MDSGRKPIKPTGNKPAEGKSPEGKSAIKKPAPKPTPDKPADKMAAKAAPASSPEKTKPPGFLRQLTAGPNPESIGLVRFILLAEVLVILVLALALVYAKFNIPRDPIPYAINTKTGQPDPLFTLHSPTKTQQALLSWVGSASADILNFGFHNVYDRLQSTEKYFTDDGWESFKEAIKNSGIIARITEKQQVITAAPTGTPVILRSGPNPQYGYAWTVQVPIYVTVLSGKETDSKRRTLTLILVPVPPEKNLSGLGIDRWLETQ